MKKPVIISIFSLSLSLGYAQESCESLLAGLEATLEQTQSMVRETKIKTGFIQVAQVKSLAKQTPDGLDVIILEQSGPQPPENAERPASENSFFGQLNLSSEQCEGHKLNVKADNTYELELVDNDDETPVLSYTMHFSVDGTSYFLKRLNALVKAPSFPVAMNMETTITEWELKN